MLISRMCCFSGVRVSVSLKPRLVLPALSLHTRSCTHPRLSACLHKLCASHTGLLNRTVVTSSASLQRLSLSYKKESADHTLKNTYHGQDVVKKEENIGIFKRFKNAYKEHGKVLIAVHLVTSTVWMSVFYYAAARFV